jgi:hypothetical protein
MKTFRQYTEAVGFDKHLEHPFTMDAERAGFKHQRTQNMVGASVHTFTHIRGHELHLKTGTTGQHSFSLMHPPKTPSIGGNLEPDRKKVEGTTTPELRNSLRKVY